MSNVELQGSCDVGSWGKEQYEYNQSGILWPEGQQVQVQNIMVGVNSVETLVLCMMRMNVKVDGKCCDPVRGLCRLQVRL